MRNNLNVNNVIPPNTNRTDNKKYDPYKQMLFVEHANEGF